jgi:hypothetical protein
MQPGADRTIRVFGPSGLAEDDATQRFVASTEATASIGRPSHSSAEIAHLAARRPWTTSSVLLRLGRSGSELLRCATFRRVPIECPVR